MNGHRNPPGNVHLVCRKKNLEGERDSGMQWE
jgi:hypothetical protein